MEGTTGRFKRRGEKETGTTIGKKEKGEIIANVSREKLVILLVGGLLRGSGMKDRNVQAVKLH